ncbi:3-keto-L-gulonate-6-phosphate decarboxylase UlaD [Xenorhabdus sp. Reich]|uniref:3-keto-L-gulonate-6-phosphate decarboxylase UlaD n=1 Tax=Xenorhabdus littoralis TaxID=2582835 RepID=A0ABU4SIU2_9GAMM|nr:3-keto-L-gulonate-6-phosphate decarboxylase UlaD [Xenorhabdus sp. Reich]MDX7998475.1 3-keto-L-gulonate-6-phosphate decarboxylase UlaD [Xenorhabdus sp. Reich]
MNRPLLQLALDHTCLDSALRDVALLRDDVDVVEAGTILCLSEGSNAIRQFRRHCPDKIIVADWKVADAGEILAAQAFDAGADWMTVICAAPLATIEKSHHLASQRNAEIQIELFGNWTFSDAKNWHSIGVRQVIYHRGRDAQANGQMWGKEDISRMKKLSDIGFAISITGGLIPEDLPQFKAISVQAFITGRALSGATQPKQVAQAFHTQITEIWG